jgi:hypothetical protein
MQDQRDIIGSRKPLMRRRSARFIVRRSQRKSTDRRLLVDAEFEYPDTPGLCRRNRRRIAALFNQERFGTEIRQIEIEFFPCVHGIERCRRRTASDADECCCHLRPVRQNDADPVVAADA